MKAAATSSKTPSPPRRDVMIKDFLQARDISLSDMDDIRDRLRHNVGADMAEMDISDTPLASRDIRTCEKYFPPGCQRTGGRPRHGTNV